MPDTQTFNLPDVGEGLTEAEIVTWKVKVGDTIKVNDVVVEIETAKSLVELPSPYAGTVTELLVGEGETVNVGTPIIQVSAGDGAAVTTDSGAADSEEVPSPANGEAVEPGLIGGPAPGGRTSVLVGYGPRTTEAKRRPRRSATPEDASPATAQADLQNAFETHPPRSPQVSVQEADPAAPTEAAQMPPSPGLPARARVLAKPPVRKRAKDLGVDLHRLTGSGPHGTVTRADVEAAGRGALGSASSTSGVASASGRVGGSNGAAMGPGRETRLPIKGVRKMTAQAMVASAFTAPHVTEWVTVDATRTMRLVKRLRNSRDFRDLKVSPLLIIARAVCTAVRRTPEVNATWDEQAEEIVLKHYVNLGVAAATSRGLVVPTIKGADQMSGPELAHALAELTGLARSGKAQPADLSGGTFTITNVGVFGVDSGTPILNPGESAILAMGAIRRQPWVVGKQIKPRWVTTLALSFDHRIVDGAQGSRFLADVSAIVEDPGIPLVL